jgi:hypothetical protein
MSKKFCAYRYIFMLDRFREWKKTYFIKWFSLLTLTKPYVSTTISILLLNAEYRKNSNHKVNEIINHILSSFI